MRGGQRENPKMLKIGGEAFNIPFRRVYKKKLGGI